MSSRKQDVSKKGSKKSVALDSNIGSFSSSGSSSPLTPEVRSKNKKGSKTSVVAASHIPTSIVSAARLATRVLGKK